MQQSLRFRFILSAATVLCVFLGIAGFILDKTFDVGFKKTIRENLKLHIFSLLSEAEMIDGEIRIAENVADNIANNRLNAPGGTLVAVVKDIGQRKIWESASAAGRDIYHPVPQTGEWLFGRSEDDSGNRFFVASYGTRWPAAETEKSFYTFTIMESADYYAEEINNYRFALLGILTAMGAILFGLQLVIMQWGLRPLRYLAKDVQAINRGKSRFLPGHYPLELKSLTSNLNLLIENERRQRERYRNTLADLSHSLKTPLAVLRGLETDVDIDGDPLSRKTLIEALRRQTVRMGEIIDYQLQRAVGSRQHLSIAATPLKREVNAIVNALSKVYAGKAVKTQISIDQSTVFLGDENDIVEILGNVLDNAYKHCRNTVKVSATETSKGVVPKLIVVIEDDGDGIDENYRASVLKRGVRLDTASKGQGVGLAVVVDIVATYNGDIGIDSSELGGALVEIAFPTGFNRK